MGATSFVNVDPKPTHLGLVRTYKAASAIKLGQVVAFADAGASNTVAPATSALGTPIGVAGNAQATAGQPVTVYMDGCVLQVRGAATNTSIDAGHWVVPDASVAGTVVEFDPAVGDTAATLPAAALPIGYTLADSVTDTDGAIVKIVVNVKPIYLASA